MEIDTEISTSRVIKGVMLGCVIGMSVMAAKCQAKEQFVLGANVASWHSNDNYDYKTWTPGLYVRENKPTFKEVGVFYNSQGFWSVHGGVGHTWQSGDLDFTLIGGAIYGYRDWEKWTYPNGEYYFTYGKPKLMLFALPSVGLRLTNDLTVRTFAMAPVGPVQAWSVSIGFEGKF